jgi:hypothetical protein
MSASGVKLTLRPLLTNDEARRIAVNAATSAGAVAEGTARSKEISVQAK